MQARLSPRYVRHSGNAHFFDRLQEEHQYFEVPQQRLDPRECRRELNNVNSTVARWMAFQGRDFYQSFGTAAYADVVRVQQPAICKEGTH